MARRLAPAATVLLLLALPAPASADTTSKRDRGGSGSAGPALDIVRVTATGNAAGLVVSVRTRGNFERQVGRGDLKGAGMALVLRPKSSAARASLLATTGPSRRQTNLFRTRSRRVGIARIGRTVNFVIRGGGLESVGRIELRTFESLSRRSGGARAADDIRITEQQARTILGEDGVDTATVGTPSAGEASCPELLETARTARATARQLNEYVLRLLDARLPQSQVRAAQRAEAAVQELYATTLLEAARKCGTGAEAICSGYRHISAGTSIVGADFGFTDIFGSRLTIQSFTFEYLNPETGRYEPVRGETNDRTSMFPLAEGRLVRVARHIHQAGRYRITATVRVRDPAKPSEVAFEQTAVAEVDVLPPQLGATGGACPPDDFDS